MTNSTSPLTATALIYAIGAGITAAAGTRLALTEMLPHDCNSRTNQSDMEKTTSSSMDQQNESIAFTTRRYHGTTAHQVLQEGG
jgi:hypothetical protein